VAVLSASNYTFAEATCSHARPKDKAKAEVAVQIAERWILARLRHETFFSLEALNERIATLHWLPGNCERSAVLSNRAASAGKSRALADSRTLLSAPKNLTLDCA
jgi:hypothetical protein